MGSSHYKKRRDAPFACSQHSCCLAQHHQTIGHVEEGSNLQSNPDCTAVQKGCPNCLQPSKMSSQTSSRRPHSTVGPATGFSSV